MISIKVGITQDPISCFQYDRKTYSLIWHVFIRINAGKIIGKNITKRNCITQTLFPSKMTVKGPSGNITNNTHVYYPGFAA